MQGTDGYSTFKKWSKGNGKVVIFTLVKAMESARNQLFCCTRHDCAQKIQRQAEHTVCVCVIYKDCEDQRYFNRRSSEEGNFRVKRI